MQNQIIFASAKEVPVSKPRQSNIELLRIIAMLMILLLHTVGAALGLPDAHRHYAVADWTKTVIESLSIVGVNLFVLISGYFGIRTTWRRIGSYLLMCGTYSIGIFAIYCIIYHDFFTWQRLDIAVRFISSRSLWFVTDYFMLMLVAPFINLALNHADKRSLDLMTAALLLISCYYGWLWGGEVNPSGYTLMQMVTIYVLGYWLSRHPVKQPVAFAVYILATAAIITCGTWLKNGIAYAYNSPAVILAAVGLFCLFRNIRIQSRFINRVAKCVFAVYLIHMNFCVWGNTLAPFIRHLHKTQTAPLFVLTLTGLIVGIYSLCILIEMGRRHLVSLITRPKQN